MNMKLIAALGCVAALALGACSGGGAPATTPDPTDPGTDARTDAEKAFDTALAEAVDDLAEARNRVTRAVNAAQTANTDEARSAAQTEIDGARKALTDALAAARALAAPSGDYDRIGKAAIQVDSAAAAEAEDLAKLRAAEGSTGWSALLTPVPREIPRTVVAATRNSRRNADGTDAATLLTAEGLPAVMYEDGKIVMAAGSASSGDRLRMRGIPVIRGAPPNPSDQRFLLLSSPPHPSLPDEFLDPAGGGNNGGEPDTVAGLKITQAGLVVDIGGKGAAGVDFRLVSLFSSAFVTADGSNGGYDLILNFGRPAMSPEGNAEHYWTAALMPSKEHLEAHGSLLKDGERPIPIGTYTMRLSNHAGLDRNLEDPDRPEPYTTDDVNHYLSYAAYGHMEFVTNLGSGVVPMHRPFPFHVGYDAFKDATGMKTTDVADADKITNGKFKGRTLASQFSVADAGSTLGSYPVLNGANYLRLRGDVELTATISGTAADNKISGKIMNLESWDVNGHWEGYDAISDDLTLQESDISPSGSYAGVIGTASLPAFAEGGYKGNFYGPLASLEAGGIWYLQDGDTVDAAARNLSIMGSFGAALVREDGTYGVAIRTGDD